jgi:hypothetical protein
MKCSPTVAGAHSSRQTAQQSLRHALHTVLKTERLSRSVKFRVMDPASAAEGTADLNEPSMFRSVDLLSWS